MGGLLVTLAAVGTFVVAGRGGEDPRRPQVVAAAALAPGHVLEATDLTTILVDLPPALADASFTSPDPLIGATVLGPVGAGELLQTAAITPAGEADARTIEFSFAVPNHLAPRSLRPGEHIALLSTTGRDADAVTVVVVPDAVVTDVEVDDQNFASNGDVIVTVAIAEPAEVLAAANATQATDITVLRLPADGSVTFPTEPTVEAIEAVGDDD